MAVCNHKTGLCIAGNGSLIAGNSNFLYGIGNHLTGFVHIQVGESTGPVITGVQSKRIASFLAVSKQHNGNVIGADAILVIAVFPRLRYGNAGLLRSIAVRHVVAVDHSGIAIDCRFRNGVGDQRTIFILIQIVERPVPVICRRYGLGSRKLTVLQQVDRDRCWAFAILVVIVIPGLAAGNRNLFRNVGVR